MLKKNLIGSIVLGVLLFANMSFAATLQGFQGGTGIATSTVGNDNKCLVQSSSTPFLTWTIGACGSGGAVSTSSAPSQYNFPYWFNTTGGLSGTSTLRYDPTTGSILIGTSTAQTGGVLYIATSSPIFSVLGNGNVSLSGNLDIGSTTPSTVPLMVMNNSAMGTIAANGTMVQIQGADNQNSRVEVNGSGGTAVLLGTRNDGTAGAPTAVQANEEIVRMSARGYGSTGFSTANKASVGIFATQNWTDTAQGTYINFRTTASGTVATNERMRIDDAGNVGIGTTTPSKLLTIGNNNQFTIDGAGNASGSRMTASTGFDGGYVNTANASHTNITGSGYLSIGNVSSSGNVTANQFQGNVSSSRVTATTGFDGGRIDTTNASHTSMDVSTRLTAPNVSSTNVSATGYVSALNVSSTNVSSTNGTIFSLQITGNNLTDAQGNKYSTSTGGGTPAGANGDIQLNLNSVFGVDTGYLNQATSSHSFRVGTSSDFSAGAYASSSNYKAAIGGNILTGGGTPTGGFVSNSTFNNTTVLIVGAGGGGLSNGSGGAGGGLTGTAGGNSNDTNGGGGGTQTAGGSAGNTDGNPGTAGQGGASGASAAGGGGGYFGGGGGGSSGGVGGGGGGGSSFMSSVLTATSTASGVNNSSGTIKLTYGSTPTVTTFSYTGSIQTWSFPAGITTSTINIQGAIGGGSGGLGGAATGTLSGINSSQVYHYCVGGQGNTGGTGGFCGGGNATVGQGTGGGMSWFDGIQQISITGNNTAMTITANLSINSTTINFASTTFKNAPVCTITASTGTTPWITNKSSSSIQANFSPALLTGQTADIICLGN